MEIPKFDLSKSFTAKKTSERSSAEKADMRISPGRGSFDCRISFGIQKTGEKKLDPARKVGGVRYTADEVTARLQYPANFGQRAMRFQKVFKHFETDRQIAAVLRQAGGPIRI